MQMCANVGLGSWEQNMKQNSWAASSIPVLFYIEECTRLYQYWTLLSIMFPQLDDKPTYLLLYYFIISRDLSGRDNCRHYPSSARGLATPPITWIN